LQDWSDVQLDVGRVERGFRPSAIAGLSTASPAN
jgi:hypothetical protein